MLQDYRTLHVDDRKRKSISVVINFLLSYISLTIESNNLALNNVFIGEFVSTLLNGDTFVVEG